MKSRKRSRPSTSRRALWKPKSDGERRRSLSGSLTATIPDRRPGSASSHGWPPREARVGSGQTCQRLAGRSLLLRVGRPAVELADARSRGDRPDSKTGLGRERQAPRPRLRVSPGRLHGGGRGSCRACLSSSRRRSGLGGSLALQLLGQNRSPVSVQIADEGGRLTEQPTVHIRGHHCPSGDELEQTQTGRGVGRQRTGDDPHAVVPGKPGECKLGGEPDCAGRRGGGSMPSAVRCR